MIVEPDRGPKRPTQRVPGANAGDLNTTRATSVKDCRLRAGQRVTIRSTTDARPCGGFVNESQTIPRKDYSKNARRKMERHGVRY